MISLGADGGPIDSAQPSVKDRSFLVAGWDLTGAFFFGYDPNPGVGSKLFQYTFDATTGVSTPATMPSSTFTSDHLLSGAILHPNGKWLFTTDGYDDSSSCCSRHGSIGAFVIDATAGTVVEQGHTKFRASSDTDDSFWYALALHPSGRFLYSFGFTRSCAPPRDTCPGLFVDLFEVSATGHLRYVSRTSTLAGARQPSSNGGATPESNLVTSVASDYLFVIGTPMKGLPVVAVFHIDQATGTPTAVGEAMSLPPDVGAGFVIASEPRP
jgi:hypothetical protein